MTLVMTATLAAAPPAGSTQRRWTAPEDGVLHWMLEDQSGLRLEFFQRLPDQSRAFFQGRGFPAAAAEELAQACVIQAVIRNGSRKSTITTELADWRIVVNGSERPFRLEADWQKRWESTGAPASARIAFRYAMLPTSQSLGPSDWLQGMTTPGLGYGQHFEIAVRWAADGVRKEARVRDVVCAEDKPLKMDK